MSQISLGTEWDTPLEHLGWLWLSLRLWQGGDTVQISNASVSLPVRFILFTLELLCIVLRMPFYIRNLSICRFWYLPGSYTQCSMTLRDNCSYILGESKVKLYVDFRLHRGSVPLIMLFKGHLYCFQHLSHQVQEEPLTSASSPTKWVTSFSGILREWPSFTKQGPMFALFNKEQLSPLVVVCCCVT